MRQVMFVGCLVGQADADSIFPRLSDDNKEETKKKKEERRKRRRNGACE